jgi:integrase
MPKRRGNREGSIFKRADGRWCAQISIQGRRLTKYAGTRAECREWIKETLAQVDQGLTLAAAKITVSALLDRWLETAKPSLAHQTWQAYERHVRLYIRPAIGHIRLQDLRPDHIQTLYTRKTEDGLAPRSVRALHQVLHRALSVAIKWGLLARNPSNGVDLPRIKPGEVRVLDPNEVETFLEAAQGQRLEPLFRLAIGTGLRQGELLGLQWRDLDWERRTLRIQRQLQRIIGEGRQFVDLKSASARRSVALGAMTIADLRRHRKHQLEERLFVGRKWQDTDLMFTTMHGGPLDAGYVRRIFKALVASIERPDMRFHDLRHTAATLMLQQGVHPKVVQERLGHAKISMTLDIYSHVLPSMQEEAAELIDDVLYRNLSQLQ